MTKTTPPDARSHLPRWAEKRLLRPYADTATHRIGGAALLRALSVLIRKHPKAALDSALAGAAQAGRTGVDEVKGAVRRMTGGSRDKKEPETPAPQSLLTPALVEEARCDLAGSLDARDVEELQKMVDEAAQRQKP